ncbi:MAG TPA: hypothetical protein VFK94_06255 [Patescibacteria group bacterium]|nr:hypothetical protein [Patescibacteria group bacterium]
MASALNSPTPKVVAATGGGGLGYALQVLLVYVYETASKSDLPQRVEDAVGFLLVTLTAFIFGYAAPREQPVEVVNEPVVVEGD